MLKIQNCNVQFITHTVIFDDYTISLNPSDAADDDGDLSRSSADCG